MPSKPKSPLGVRVLFSVSLTESEGQLVHTALQLGYSKQELVTLGLGLIDKESLPGKQPWGSQRKLQVFRVAPETLMGLKDKCAKWKATQALVVVACAKALIGIQKS